MDHVETSRGGGGVFKADWFPFFGKIQCLVEFGFGLDDRKVRVFVSSLGGHVGSSAFSSAFSISSLIM